MDVKNEFSVGNMAPVVQPDQILSKTGDYEYVDDVFNALDLGFSKTEESDSEDVDDTTESSTVNVDANELDDTVTESKKIDDDMLPITKALEAKGYDVKYSCSGHPSARAKNDAKRDGVRYSKLYTTARIVFGKKYDIGSAPKGWVKKSLNTDDDKYENDCTALYVKEKIFDIADGTPKNAFYKWKASYMSSLKSWVEKLPAAGDKEATTESVDVSLDTLLDDMLVDML